MGSLKFIKKQIMSTEGTGKLTSAMKMVSASKLRKAQEFMLTVNSYSKKLREMISIASRLSSHKSDYFRQAKDVKNAAIIVIGSDRGLCGGYNASVEKEALKLIDTLGNVNLHITSIGSKINSFFKYRGYSLAKSLSNSVDFESLSEIGDGISFDFMSLELDAAYILSNSFVSSSSYVSKVVKLLPLTVETLEDGSVDTSGGENFNFESTADEVLDSLVPKFLNLNVYSNLLESLAVEHSARMMAMDMSTKNAKEMVDGLRIKYNNLRQSNITSELLDIINGAEALV